MTRGNGRGRRPAAPSPSAESQDNRGPALIKRIWRWLWSPHSRFSLGFLLIVGGLGGIVFWGGFNTFMEYTNRLEFCIACHEMESTVYEEYRETTHFSNPSGVGATCSDCHVPREWTAKLLRKIYATNEFYHWVIGSVDTPGKFEAKRLEMAERVWSSMMASDSRECRNCHSYASMNFEKQRDNAKKVMKEALDEGRTCIECHRGIAHKMPDLMLAFAGSLAGEHVEAGRAIAVGPQAVTLIAEDGSELGTLMPGAPLKVLASDETRVRVELEGWAPVVYRLIVTKDVGQRLSFAQLTEKGTQARKVVATTDDLYGEKWEEVRLTGWAAKPGLAVDAKSVWELADRIYQNRCDSCHTAHAPDSYSTNQWPGNLDSMADYGGLMDKELVLVRQYLQTHAKTLLIHRPAEPEAEEAEED